MSKKDEKVSAEGQDELQTGSVFDFLYHDSRRVGSFLAQLDENGLLTGVRQSEHASKGGKRGFSATLGANHPVVGGGNVGMELTPTEGGGEALERTYDPLWANARELLNVLSTNNMIQEDITAAALGSIVLVSGSLNVIDLSMIRALWALPTIQRAVHLGGDQPPPPPPPLQRHGKRGQGRQQVQEEPKNPETELLLEVLPVLPHALNALLTGTQGQAWVTLEEEHLVGRASDIILKHGASVPGEWHLIGILDAQPDLDNLADVVGEMDTDFDPASLVSNSVIGQITKTLAPIIRLLLGRPSNAYGLTPLMVFREVQGHTRM